MMAKKEICGAKHVMKPLKWVAECQKPKGHKGEHERWSETRKWVFHWEDQ